MNRFTALLLICTIGLAACGQTPAAISGMSAPVILTTTTFLADITRNVAGDRFAVESLLPVGADPHTYQPTPQDVTRIASARLLIINGADYERFLGPLLDAAGAGEQREIVEASTGVNLRNDAQSGEVDPHVWLDPNSVIIFVQNIREALTHFDPQDSSIFQTNASMYTRRLTELDDWIQQQVDTIPMTHRLLVTNHESLGYFAERYGFTITGTVIESFNSDASPSARQMADLIEQIKSSGAPAIFLDAGDNSTLARQIAAETGVRVVTDLHLESLTDGPPAGTYIDMMMNDVTLIVKALK